MIIVSCYLRWAAADASAEADADPYYQTFGYGNTGYAGHNLYYAPRYPAYPAYGYSTSPAPIYGSPSRYPAAYGHFVRNPAPSPIPHISGRVSVRVKFTIESSYVDFKIKLRFLLLCLVFYLI